MSDTKVPRKKGFGAALGAAIRARRKAAGLVMQDVEERTGGAITPSTLAGYESGLSVPGLSRMLIICAALSCSLYDLLPPAVLGAKSDAARLAAIVEN